MTDGYAFKRALASDRHKDEAIEPAWTRWPVESQQVLLRTEDGQAPRGSGAIGTGDWERVWKLADVENLYDLGFWDNLADVFLPVSGFRDQRDREEVSSEASRRNSSSSASETDALVQQ